jgi:hypothetical protein
VLDLYVKEVRFIPLWIFSSTPADWWTPILPFADVNVNVRIHLAEDAS